MSENKYQENEIKFKTICKPIEFTCNNMLVDFLLFFRQIIFESFIASF